MMRTAGEERAEAPIAARSVSAVQAAAWADRLIALLTTAVTQLSRDKCPGAHSSILEATSLLRVQFCPPVGKAVPSRGGRLLAWQSRRVRDYIESHLADRLRVTELAALVNRSPAHFSRAFKATFGETPRAFVFRRRIELAAKYLASTDMCLSEVAMHCGFADQAHLCKRFREATGRTPTLWRHGHLPGADDEDALARQCS